MDDSVFYLLPHRIGNNILCCGKKNSTFPFHCLVSRYFVDIKLISSSHVLILGWAGVVVYASNICHDYHTHCLLHHECRDPMGHGAGRDMLYIRSD